MSYDTAEAFRMALEQRLSNRSRELSIPIDRLRRRVVFERVVARLVNAEPGMWVVKGGMALEVRLGQRARLTKDIDLGLRDVVAGAGDLQERLVESLIEDPYGDRFVFNPGPSGRLRADGGGHVTWRCRVAAHLAGRPFGGIQIDVSPRVHELGRTDTVPLPNSLDFAAIETPAVQIVDVNRHAAEKFHAMSRTFDDRENSRVRDLADLALLIDNDLLERAALARAVRDVWHERDATEPPNVMPTVPDVWSGRYERLAADNDITPRTFAAAVATAAALWTDLRNEHT